MYVFTDYDDFVLSSGGTVVLTAEEPVQCINISVVNDDVREFNETASLVIIPQDPVDQVAEGNFTMIIIVDDGDGKIQSVTVIDAQTENVKLWTYMMYACIHMYKARWNCIELEDLLIFTPTHQQHNILSTIGYTMYFCGQNRNEITCCNYLLCS